MFKYVRTQYPNIDFCELYLRYGIQTADQTNKKFIRKISLMSDGVMQYIRYLNEPAQRVLSKK